MEKFNIPEENSLNSMEGIDDTIEEKNNSLEKSKRGNYESENHSEMIIRTFINNITSDIEKILYLCNIREERGLNKLIDEDAIGGLKVSINNLIEISQKDKIDNEEFYDVLTTFSQSLAEFGATDRAGMARDDLEIIRAFHQPFQNLSTHFLELGEELSRINQDDKNKKLIEQLEKIQHISDERIEYIGRLYQLLDRYLNG